MSECDMGGQKVLIMHRGIEKVMRGLFFFSQQRGTGCQCGHFHWCREAARFRARGHEAEQRKDLETRLMCRAQSRWGPPPGAAFAHS